MSLDQYVQNDVQFAPCLSRLRHSIQLPPYLQSSPVLGSTAPFSSCSSAKMLINVVFIPSLIILQETARR